MRVLSDELPESQSIPTIRAPGGVTIVVSAEEHYSEVFKKIEEPKKKIPAIQLVETDRKRTLPFLMRGEHMKSWQDVFGPIDWPGDVPTAEMTSTYIPTERDERFDNANLAEKDSMFEQSSRMGFFHYYNSLFWRMTADHFELTGETHLLTELKAQTFVHKTDHMFCIALNPEFMGLRPKRDPDGSAKLAGQGPTRLSRYWPQVKEIGRAHV